MFTILPNSVTSSRWIKFLSPISYGFAGWWKCGIKARCSVCFYRWIKDHISFISNKLFFILVSDFLFFEAFLLQNVRLTNIICTGNRFCGSNNSNIHWTVWTGCLQTWRGRPSGTETLNRLVYLLYCIISVLKEVLNCYSHPFLVML